MKKIMHICIVILLSGACCSATYSNENYNVIDNYRWTSYSNEINNAANENFTPVHGKTLNVPSSSPVQFRNNSVSTFYEFNNVDNENVTFGLEELDNRIQLPFHLHAIFNDINNAGDENLIFEFEGMDDPLGFPQLRSSFNETNDWDNGYAIGEVVPISDGWFVLSFCISIYSIYIMAMKKKKSRVKSAVS
ncbi:MAG: hypothetical protein LBR52_03175 [Prevotellaceae bacterium]|jgi:hypothetical protein|nr:hypothetical protein [Prevotellaceae bacterium]